MYDWDDLRYFLALHRGASLVDAARVVRADPTTVSRRITALEKALGTKLFVRSKEGWSLTPTGERMLPAAEEAERGALAVQRGIDQLREDPEGRVRITTLESIASWWLITAFDELRTGWPGIRVDLLCTPRILDLARGEATSPCGWVGRSSRGWWRVGSPPWWSGPTPIATGSSAMASTRRIPT